MVFHENRMNPDGEHPKRPNPNKSDDPEDPTMSRILIVGGIVFFLAIASICGLGAFVRSPAAHPPDAGSADTAR